MKKTRWANGIKPLATPHHFSRRCIGESRVLGLQCASASLLFCMLTWHAERGRRGHVTHTTCGRTGVLTIHKHIFLFSANVARPRALKQAHTLVHTHTHAHMHTYAKRVKLKWQSKAGPTTMAARGKTGASQVCGCCSCCSYCHYCCCCCWASFLFSNSNNNSCNNATWQLPLHSLLAWRKTA